MNNGTDRKRGIISVAAGFTLMFFCGVAYSYGVAMPSIREAFDLSKAQASIPFSAILLSYTAGMWAGGIFQDRIGTRKACVAGAILFGAGFTLAGYCSSFALLVTSYGLFCGFGIGVSYIAATATAVCWFPERRGLAAGCVVLGFGLGALVLAPLKHWLITLQGWRSAFILMGLFFLVSGVLLALLVRPPAGELEVKGESAPQPLRDLSTREMIATATFRKVWLAWALCLSAGLGWMAHLAAMTQKAGISPALAAWTLSAVALANGLSRPIAGALADRIGRLTTLSYAGIIFALVIMFMLLPIEGGWRFFVMSLVFGACFGTLLVNYSPLAAEFFGSKNLGSNLGLLYTSYGVGALTGPALFGTIYDKTGSYNLAIIFSLVMVIMGVALFKSTKQPQSGESQELKAATT